MTGTGVQSDPYIPTTLTEFINAVGTAGAYVALTQDINAADDPEYSGELTSEIAINAANVEGAGHTVSGVTFNAVYGFTLASGSYVYDLTLRDIAGKATVAGAFFVGSGSSNCGLRGCKAAIKLDGGTQYIAYDTGFFECALDVTCTSDVNSTIFSGCGFYKTTIAISGASLAYSSAINISTFSRSAIIFYAPKRAGYAVFNYNSSLTYSYVCIADPVTGTVAIGSPSMTLSIVATTDGQALSAPSSAILATIDQMKDKDWLTSVGFLP